MKYTHGDPYHVIIEIENRFCRMLKILETLGIHQFKVVDVRGSGEGSIRHLVKMPTELVDKIPKETLVKTLGSSKFKGNSYLWIESEGCDICNTILCQGSFLLAGRHIRDFTLVYDFIVPDFDAYKRIISALESHNLKLKILKVGKFKLKGGILTEKQETVLWLALKTGFFDYPKKINTAKLSRKLGISSSTLSEVIRRGTRRLLKNYFEEKP